MSNVRRELPVIQSNDTTGAPPIFEKVGIVGLGLIGGSIALAARQLWPGGLVIGVDEKAVLETAMVRHAIDVAADDLGVLAEVDLVILAAPVRQNLERLDELERHVQGPTVVTDVGSTKREIVERAEALPKRFSFVGGHPLGGAPRSGLEHARPDLFKNRPWLFTPTGDGLGPILERLQQFVEALGARPHIMSPADHDRLLAFISHLPQLTASALMHVVGGTAGADGLALTGRGLADTTRLASSPATIWRDICASNADEIRNALDQLIGELERLRDGLGEDGDDGEDLVEGLFESAATWRAVLADRVGKERAG